MSYFSINKVLERKGKKKLFFFCCLSSKNEIKISFVLVPLKAATCLCLFLGRCRPAWVPFSRSHLWDFGIWCGIICIPRLLSHNEWQLQIVRYINFHHLLLYNRNPTCFHYKASLKFQEHVRGDLLGHYSLNYFTWQVSFELSMIYWLRMCGRNWEISIFGALRFEMFDLNYRWLLKHCGMTEVRIIGNWFHWKLCLWLLISLH